MKKGILLTLMTAVLLAAGIILSRDGACAETIELKMAHFMSPMHIQHQQSFLPFARKVEELTGGKVKIKVYPGGTLGDATQLADSARTGIADIAFFVPSYMTGRFPRTSALDLPFLFDNAEHATRVFYDLFDRYLAEDYKDYKVLWLYSCDAGQFFSVEKPIRTLEDLRGMKIRTHSAYMSQTLKLLGANPVGMPLSELHAALGKKIVDGTLAPTSAIYDFKLENLIRHSARLNVYTSPMVVVMNREKFNSLPEEVKKAIDKASGKEWGLRAAKLYDDLDTDTVKKMKASGKINIYSLPAAEIRKHMDRVKVMEAEWVEKAAQKGLPSRELMEALRRSVAGSRAK